VKTITILLDSGSSETIVSDKLVKNLPSKKTKAACQWNTAAGSITTNRKVELQFSLPEFYATTVIKHSAHVFNSKIEYDMILGRDLMQILGIDLSFRDQRIYWGDAILPMKPFRFTYQSFKGQQQATVETSTERLTRILEAKYKKADLEEVV